MNKKNKQNKGITLIALIITIVVLLILAVVTINAVNEGNLFVHANNAATRYQEEAQRENDKISELLSKIPGEGGGTGTGEIPDALRRYILGEDGKGVIAFVEAPSGDGIWSIMSGVFTNNSIIENASSTLHAIVTDNDMNYIDIYFKYDGDGKYYKVKCDYVTTYKTMELTEVYTPTQSTNIGRTLTYAGKSYTVISDNGTDIELVANYLSEDKLTIGASTYAEALAAYNNVITTLNSAAITASGLTIGGDVKNIRSIGNSGNNDNSGNYANQNPTELPLYEGNAKESDTYFEKDVMKMYEANILKDMQEEYWMASRKIYEMSSNIAFGLHIIIPSHDSVLDSISVCNINSSAYGSAESYYVRPVVILSKNATGITWNS